MIDRYGKELGGLSSSHFMTHKGRGYYASLSLAAVAAATTVDCSIVTDATHEAHMRITARANQGVQTLTLIEAPTGVTGGSTVVAKNKNRNFPSTDATTVLKTGVTGTTGGTIVLPAKRITGAYETDLAGEEIVLKANTIYVLRLLTGAGAGNEVDYSLDFYENIGQGVDKSQPTT
jgi:hypothetical protein